LLISKVRAAIAAATLVVATAAITAIAASKWNLFPPKDYEECSERAAKDAKSKDALSVLLSICRADFEGRRKAGGGYTYYDTCQSRTFDIKGPNPSPDEIEYIKMQCSGYLDEAARAAKRLMQQEQEARAERILTLELRKSKAIINIQAIPKGVTCFQDHRYEVPCEGRYRFDGVKMEVEVTNRSNDALSNISIGLASVPTEGDACPKSYAERKELRVRLSPGETRVSKIGYLDAEFSKYRVCIKVIDVEFASNYD
jgi:hypothetical protein